MRCKHRNCYWGGHTRVVCLFGGQHGLGKRNGDVERLHHLCMIAVLPHLTEDVIKDGAKVHGRLLVHVCERVDAFIRSDLMAGEVGRHGDECNKGVVLEVARQLVLRAHDEKDLSRLRNTCSVPAARPSWCPTTHILYSRLHFEGACLRVHLLQLTRGSTRETTLVNRNSNAA
jgi:hypothetical protein